MHFTSLECKQFLGCLRTDRSAARLVLHVAERGRVVEGEDADRDDKTKAAVVGTHPSGAGTVDLHITPNHAAALWRPDPAVCAWRVSSQVGTDWPAALSISISVASSSISESHHDHPAQTSR